jgi:DNA polymerase-3 subunit epsilon
VPTAETARPLDHPIDHPLDTDRAWAVVDVETSGLHAGSHRVLSVAALALDAAGRPAGPRFASLVNADCDPGPVHVHGLTRERLAGAPRFAEIAPQLREVLDGRVLVAHNAAFDHRFLAAEADRAGVALPVRQRLCTLALSRRLGLDVPDHRLGTLADYWGVPQERAHEADDDVAVLARVLTHSLLLAARLGLPLPLVDADGRGTPRWPARAVARPSPWRNPGRWTPGAPLVQGMRLVVTGPTREPRPRLHERLVAAGLDVGNSVSRVTSALVTNDAATGTRKAQRARAEGVPVLDETALLALLDDVAPGEPVGPARPAARAARPRRSAPAGPLRGRRVLVLGGTHAQAAAVRTEVGALGGAAAVNLSASVTDVVLMAGGETDRRLPRIREAQLPVHTGAVALGITLPAPSPQPAEPVYVGRHRSDAPGAGVPVLTRGAVVDLPDEPVWTVNVAWRADALATGTGTGVDIDVVALLVDADDRVVADEDLVFYNAPLSEHGAVALSVDGDSEQSVRIDLGLLGEEHRKVVVAAAVDGDAVFGDVGAVTVSVDGATATAATATLDAATTERTLLLAEVYRRDGAWRVRAVGQGYDDGLAGLAVRHGVAVDDR